MVDKIDDEKQITLSLSPIYKKRTITQKMGIVWTYELGIYSSLGLLWLVADVPASITHG